jgi:hypothetical protein
VYVDNTALAMTVATMITDCLAGDETLDCADKTLDVVLVNDGNSDPAANGLGSFFSDTGTPVGTYHHSGGPKGLALVPSQMIFAEPYPKNVTNYFTPSAIAAIQKWLKNPSRLPADLISSAASGRLNEATFRGRSPDATSAEKSRSQTLSRRMSLPPMPSAIAPSLVCLTLARPPTIPPGGQG